MPSRALIPLLCILLGGPGTSRPARAPWSAAAVRDQLRLHIASTGAHRSALGNWRLGLRATITNVSRKPTRFFLQRCGICFWSIAFNGAAFEPASTAKHAVPCPYINEEELKPGETRTVDWVRTYRTEAEVRGLKTVRLRYALDRHGSRLESNALTLPAPTERALRPGAGCGGCSFCP